MQEYIENNDSKINKKNPYGNSNYEPVIGLETHIELNTATKMFCGCKLSFGAEPNTYTCPVCLGHPGSLPVINEKAVEFAIKIALALNCTVNGHSIFHRKNYFYPDMPKNYQISQYDLPVGSNGYLEVKMDDYIRRVGITRVHMEEDTGKLVHTGSTGRISESAESIVDFNRAGTPLIEIVTEPDIKSPAEAKEYLITLRNLILYLDVSDCSMEEGSLRCDANVSVRIMGSEKMGTKTEIKNMNSFKFLQKGLEYEIKRQTELISGGGEVIQQTRHYDNITDSTKVLRSKEEAQDYRYFPEPDLVPMHLDLEITNRIGETIPELPYKKAARFITQFGLPKYDSKFLSEDKDVAYFFEECLKYYDNPKALSNWIMGDLSSLLNKEGIGIKCSKITPVNLGLMLEIVDSGKISSKMAKTVFEEMFITGENPQKIIEEKGFEQISDENILERIIIKVVEENPGTVEQYKSGKEKALDYLVGQVMKITEGKSNPGKVNEILLRILK